MFNSCLYDILQEKDNGMIDLSNPVVKAVYDEHFGMMEMYIDLWLDDDKSDDGFINHFYNYFPAGFISRDINRAKQIIYDLKDIAESTVIRKELAPIYVYVMYYIIKDWCDWNNDCYPDRKMPMAVEKYLLNIGIKSDSDEYLMISSWFTDEEDKAIDFVEIYDGDYVFQDEIESIATIYLDHEYGNKELENLDIRISDFFDLLPNDLYVRVRDKYLSEQNKGQENGEKERVCMPDLHQEIIKACIKLSDNSISTCKLDEDGLNRYIRDILQSSLSHFHYSIYDQTQQGYSSGSKGPGELDIRIAKNNMPIINCECLIHKDKRYLYEHINKVIRNYNPIGCKNTYIICYFKGQNYNRFWNTFLKWVNSFDNVYDLNELGTAEYAGIKQAIGKYKSFDEEGIITFIGVNIQRGDDL